jgi:hypothetical protein
MRQIQLRTLAAQGITVQQSVRIKGLSAYQAQDDRGRKLIVLSGALLGTSWAAIGNALESQSIEFTIMTLGRPHLLAVDTSQLRSVLEDIELASKRSRSDEVFVKDVGFLVSGLSRKFDVRALIAPALLLLLTLGLATSQQLEPVALEDPEPEATLLTCALDMVESEFNSWLKTQISGREVSSARTFVIRTDLGEINMEIEQSLGSTQFVTGVFNCEDNRSKRFQFRTDSQPGRALVDLGSSLDP